MKRTFFVSNNSNSNSSSSSSSAAASAVDEEGGGRRGEEVLVDLSSDEQDDKRARITTSYGGKYAPLNISESFVHVQDRGKSGGSNHSYQCPHCKETFIGGPSKIKAHFYNGTWSSVRVGACKVVRSPEVKSWINDELMLLVAEENRKTTMMPTTTATKTAHHQATMKGQQTLHSCFEGQFTENIEMAILAFLAANNLPPNLVGCPYLKDLLNACAVHGATNKQGFVTIPDRKQFGLSGTVLQKGLKLVQDSVSSDVKLMAKYGNTLCSDGAKNNKRSALNTVLVTPGGTFFVQSTDATRTVCKDAAFLKGDIDDAIKYVGEENVFLVCMDGACKGTLDLVDKGYSRVFPQRCATHGFSLLHKDLTSFFDSVSLDVLKWALRGMKLFVNHTYLYGELLHSGAKALQTPVETRFASLVLCCELFLKDKTQMIEIVHKTAVQEWKERQTADVKREFDALRRNVFSNDAFWSKLQVFVSLETPVKVALRGTDTETPNLMFTSEYFEKAKVKSLEVAAAAEASESNIPVARRCFTGLVTFTEGMFQKRRKDCVSTLALAAAMIVPHYNYITDPSKVFRPPDEASGAIYKVITKYFGTLSTDPIEIQAAEVRIQKAEKQYHDFRTHLLHPQLSNQQFRRLALSYVGEDGSIIDKNGVLHYWLACETILPDFAPLAIKLCTAFAGQGSSERCNKDVTLIRSKTRNRQTHEVTCAYLTLKSYFRFQKNLKKKKCSTDQQPRTVYDMLREEKQIVEELEDDRRDDQEQVRRVTQRLELAEFNLINEDGENYEDIDKFYLEDIYNAFVERYDDEGNTEES